MNEHVPVIREDNLKRSRGYQCDGLAKNPGQENKNTSVCLPHATEIIPELDVGRASLMSGTTSIVLFVSHITSPNTNGRILTTSTISPKGAGKFLPLKDKFDPYSEKSFWLLRTTSPSCSSYKLESKISLK